MTILKLEGTRYIRADLIWQVKQIGGVLSVNIENHVVNFPAEGADAKTILDWFDRRVVNPIPQPISEPTVIIDAVRCTCLCHIRSDLTICPNCECVPAKSRSPLEGKKPFPF